MSRHYAIDERLTPDHLEELKNWIREKNYTRTLDETQKWLTDKQYSISRTAIWTWMDDFRLGEKARDAVERSGVYLTEKGKSDPTAIPQAAMFRLNELIMDWTFREEEPEAGEMMKIAIALKTGLGGMLDAVKLQRELIDLKKRQTEAVEAAQKMASEGKSGETVVKKVRELLGIT